MKSLNRPVIEDCLQNVAAVVRAYRKAKGYGQIEFGRIVGLHGSQISNIENGVKEMDIYTALHWENTTKGDLPIELLTPWFRYELGLDKKPPTIPWFDRKELNIRVRYAIVAANEKKPKNVRYKTSIKARMRLGILLKMYRNKMGTSQIEFSKEFGITQGYLSLLENGNGDLSFNKAIEWANRSKGKLLLQDMCFDLYEGRKYKPQ